MLTLLLLLGLLLNGDFSQGLAYWNADVGWSAQNGMAVLKLDNRNSTETQGAVMCSDAYLLNGQKTLSGAADVFTQNRKGYLFVGVRWYDGRGNRLWDENWASNEGKTLQVWERLSFRTHVPRAAKRVSFCFFAGAYEGGQYKVTVDNASLQ